MRGAVCSRCSRRRSPDIAPSDERAEALSARSPITNVLESETVTVADSIADTLDAETITRSVSSARSQRPTTPIVDRKARGSGKQPVVAFAGRAEILLWEQNGALKIRDASGKVRLKQSVSLAALR